MFPKFFNLLPPPPPRRHGITDENKIRALSLIQEEGGKAVRMANMSIVGSHSINGVAEIHSQLLKDKVCTVVISLDMAFRRVVVLNHPDLPHLL